MQRRFWREAEIQQFWSGESFQRTDDGNLLSYELARVLVEQMARDWTAFAEFVRHARRDDAGAASAIRHLGIDLGAAAAALTGKPETAGWAPHAAAATLASSACPIRSGRSSTASAPASSASSRWSA